MSNKSYWIISGALLVFVLAGGAYLEFTKNEQMNAIDDKSSVELKNLGLAPELTGLVSWLNTDPLKIEDLRGKAVLVDFWTYSCINCIRTLPYLTQWHKRYVDKGLVIIGVHTPEFEFEKVPENVQTAIRRYGIEYPVALDNNYSTWRAYQNRYWPAKYLIDQEGRVVYTHFGEGDYEQTENAIRELLGMEDVSKDINNTEIRKVGTPEIYLGLNRLEYYSGDIKPSSEAQDFTKDDDLPLNRFSLSGRWRHGQENAILDGANGSIFLRYYASQVHMVAEAPEGATIEVYLDGQLQQNIDVSNSQLYTLIDGVSGEYLLELRVLGSGFRIYTLTFG